LDRAERATLTIRLDRQPGGRELVAALTRVLSSTGEIDADTAQGVVRRGRATMTRATLAPRNLPSTWAQRRSILPLRRGATTPFGLRTRGAVVVLVGTDGSGKSTVQRALSEALEAFCVPTRTAYFGMAHGNLPGVGLARRLLGVGEQPKPRAVPSSGPVTPSVPEPTRLTHPGLRRVAAWFYAAEYVWRWLSLVAPHRARGRVVVCDRWVTDLRHSPWPGSAASAVLERIVPAPDVLVLPDAPDEVIHARKPERAPAEQAGQQDLFRRLAAEEPARGSTVVVDTAGAGPDVEPAIAAVLEAVHGVRRRRRP
jgi:thymidylate kinase